MAAKDIFHDNVVHALQKDGWIVTNEPLSLKVSETDLFIDIGAERFIAASKGRERIAVEVKSFIKLSAVQDLKEAVGQFIIYEDALRLSPVNADRVLYLAVRDETYADVFSDNLGKMLLTNKRVRLLVFNVMQEVITQWI